MGSGDKATRDPALVAEGSKVSRGVPERALEAAEGRESNRLLAADLGHGAVVQRPARRQLDWLGHFGSLSSPIRASSSLLGLLGVLGGTRSRGLRQMSCRAPNVPSHARSPTSPRLRYDTGNHPRPRDLSRGLPPSGEGRIRNLASPARWILSFGRCERDQCGDMRSWRLVVLQRAEPACRIHVLRGHPSWTVSSTTWW